MTWTPDPGIYEDVPMDVYHSSPYTSAHHLLNVSRAPALARHALDNPIDLGRPGVVGSAFHAMMQGRRYFEAEFVVRPPGIDGRTKAGRAALAELRESGLEVLTPEEGEAIEGMAAAVWAHPTAASLIADGALGTSDVLREVSVVVDDPETGERCRLRPDVWRQADRVVIDFKSTKDARPGPFARSVAAFGYHVTAAFYSDLLGAERFVWIAVEKAAPYLVAVYSASLDSLVRGSMAWRDALAQLGECRETGRWPGYPTEITEIELPPWA